MNTPSTLAEGFLTQTIAKERAFDVPQAVLYALLGDGFAPIGAATDVYDLLETAVVPSEAQALLVHTTGWAAPLTDDGEVMGAPSRHPQRRRVVLMACVTDDDGETVAGSALGFADDPDNIITDDGAATGSLAVAIAEAWANR